MKIQNFKVFTLFFLLSSVLFLSVTKAQVNEDYLAYPSLTADATTPLVMLSISADHQYFFKAYSDYSDLDDNLDNDPTNDDGPETTYKNSYQYYGYFDSNKCYEYNIGDERFVPVGFQNTPYYCDDISSNSWSGNFLNWSTMTRMDVVRKIFYGGFRSTDTSTLTVLERAHLPTDAHSFAKYYNGDDIERLTPFDSLDVNWDGDGNSNVTNGNSRTDVIGQDDLIEGITICNTSPDFAQAYQRSHDSDAPPVMRVVRGNFQLWASNERWQCTWDNEKGDNSNRNNSAQSGMYAYSSDPDKADNGLPAGTNVYDRVVRIEVCNSTMINFAGENNENCKQYPDGNYKPTGILNQYGEQGQIHFGLMTGGFQANTEGGVLRKRIREFTDEVNVDTDGTFTGEAGIVSNLNALRIFGYRYDQGLYFGGNSQDACNFQQTDINHGNECFSWGNPISEILKESINYLSGNGPTTAFNQTDENKINAINSSYGFTYPGLSVEEWGNAGQDPLADDNACAAVTQIVINASVSSFDENVGIAHLPGSPNIDAITDQVGAIEGIDGNSYFVGESDTDNNLFCTAKTVNNLSDVRGVCPEAPTVEGSYHAAGLAYYAKITDLRPATPGVQSISTLGITLATNSPVIEVPIGPVGSAESMRIVPAYRLQKNEGGGGALVDFKILQGHTETFPGSGVYEGKYYVNWEDSEQGGDYDNDVWGLLNYSLDTTNDTITISTNAITLTGGGAPQLYGYITTGTTQDGFHAHSGVLGSNYTDSTGVGGCTNCRALSEGGGGQRGFSSHTYTLDNTNVGEELESPLYYAAKYGSFVDSDGDDAPNLETEFDVENNVTGEAGADGIPDGYFAATSPATLVDSIGRALSSVLVVGAGSSSTPAVISSSDGSLNLVTQALFYEETRSEVDEEGVITWTGDLRSYFVDVYGNFREDNGVPGELDDSNTDYVFKFETPDDSLQSMVQRYRFTDEDLPYDERINPLIAVGGLVPAEEISTVWSVSDMLSELDDADLEDNRAYTSPFSTSGDSRYIMTWVDEDQDGIVDTGEYMPFESDEILGSQGSMFQALMGFPGTPSATPLDIEKNQNAANVVDFIRGIEGIPAFRNRTITLDGDTVTRRLGDIVGSSPLVVSPPSLNYDLVYNDTSYLEFKEAYQNRRTVVYVGGNDGLLHAFNAGFKTSSVDKSILYSDLDGPDNSGVAHPLGAELWAYAPMNLLPHMQWLTDPDYSHVFYVDGEPQSFDVNIFPDSATHPNGWGTILVVGMGLGGGEFPLDMDLNGTVDPDTEILRSSYLIFDITDPEQEPVLLGEINHDELDHTTVTPTVVKNRNGADNQWTLVFGSGPDNRGEITSSNDAKVFALDLELSAGTLVNTTPFEFAVPNPGGEGAFVGSMTAVDWDFDYKDDVVYFGTIEQDIGVEDQTGAVFRFLPNASTPASDINFLMDIERPVQGNPLVVREQGENFVYFGTGRYLTKDDSTTDEQEYYIGIMEDNVHTFTSPFYKGSYSTVFDLGDVLNLDGIQVNRNFGADATVDNPNIIDVTVEGAAFADIDGNGTVLYSEFESYLLSGNGIYRGTLRELEQNIGAPSERVIFDSDHLGGLLGFSSFTPEVVICEAAVGTVNLYVVSTITGAASDLGPFQDLLDPTNIIPGGSDELTDSIELGVGIGSDVIFSYAGEGSNQTIQATVGGLGSRTSDFAGVKLSNPNAGDLSRINWRQIDQ